MVKRCVLFFLLFTLFCDNSLSAIYPRVPCPDIFRYEQNFGDYTGIITLDNLKYGETELEIELSQPGTIYPGAEGYLNLNIDENEITDYIRLGRPITYKVDFPLRKVIPQVSSIKLNGDTICYGPRVPGRSTTITLRHTLTTSGPLNILPPSFNARRPWTIPSRFVNQYPRSPCPDVFQYVRVNGNDIGLISIDRMTFGETVINIELSQPGSIRPDAEGHLSLNFDEDKLLDYIRSGRPIIYRVDFPLENVVPEVSHITVNGSTVCFGSRVPSPSTQISLRNTLYVPAPLQDSRIQNFLSDSRGLPWRTISNYSRPSFGNSNFLSSSPRFKKPDDVYYELSEPFFNDNRNNDILFQPAADKVDPQVTTNTPLPLKISPPTTTITSTSTTTSAPPPTTTTSIKPNTEGPATMQYINSVCGRENFHFTANSLAVNGQMIPRARFPWIVAIYKKNPQTVSFQCGGSLISARTVISAAHCFYSNYGVIKNENILISLGRHNLTDWTDSHIIQSDVETIIRHPDYRPELINNDADLAVVLLKVVVTFSPVIRPVCLWQGPINVRDIDGVSGIVVGWGRDENNVNVTTTPRLITASVASEVECLRSNDQLRYLTSNRTLCAGNRNGSGPCNGDSGSGLMIRNRNKWMIRGTVSASLTTPLNQCNLDEYVIYTDIAKFIGWIEENMLL